MNELVIPNEAVHDVATYQVLIEGKAIDPSYQLLSLSISREINRIPVATLVFRDGEAAERDFKISNEDIFVPGKKVKINIGRDGSNKQGFQGIVNRHAIRIKEDGKAELHIECRDEAVRMTIGRHSKYYRQLKDSRLFDELIGKYSGLKSDPETTTLEHKEIVQHHISDWDFMLLRAEANGMLVNVIDGTIKVSRPDTSPDPVLQVAYGSSVLQFEAEMDARNQWENVEAKSWDYSNQQLFKADTSSAKFTEPGNIKGSDLAKAIDLKKYELHHSGHLLQQELQDWVNGSMLRSRMAKVRGRAKFDGFGGIKPGDMVKLEGVGNRFKGNSYVTAVRQEIGKGIWQTHIQFGLDPNIYAQAHRDVFDEQSAGLIGSIHGLQIGKVVQLQNDPDGDDRILVKIPTLDNDGQGIWTRVASLDAGSKRGAFFRPEIDDEVIIGFINDDPRHAIMLGMLNSSAKPAPVTAQDANDEKGFTTRSNMQLYFNDKTKTIKIKTPAGNSITLDEQGTMIEITDQNQNKMTMDTSGIKIESPKNIDIKAGVNLTLGAGATLSIGGVSLSIKADADVSIKGSQGSFDGGSMTVIKGGSVMIN